VEQGVQFACGQTMRVHQLSHRVTTLPKPTASGCFCLSGGLCVCYGQAVRGVVDAVPASRGRVTATVGKVAGSFGGEPGMDDYVEIVARVFEDRGSGGHTSDKVRTSTVC
jgi:hypothetical protein